MKDDNKLDKRKMELSTGKFFFLNTCGVMIQYQSTTYCLCLRGRLIAGNKEEVNWFLVVPLDASHVSFS